MNSASLEMCCVQFSLVYFLAIVRSFEDEGIFNTLLNVDEVLNTIEAIDSVVMIQLESTNGDAFFSRDNHVNDLTVVFLENICMCFQRFSQSENPVMSVTTGNTSFAEKATLSVSASSRSWIDSVCAEGLSILNMDLKTRKKNDI
jgi:hypothetical protein